MNATVSCPGSHVEYFLMRKSTITHDIFIINSKLLFQRHRKQKKTTLCSKVGLRNLIFHLCDVPYINYFPLMIHYLSNVSDTFSISVTDTYIFYADIV